MGLRQVERWQACRLWPSHQAAGRSQQRLGRVHGRVEPPCPATQGQSCSQRVLLEAVDMHRQQLGAHRGRRGVAHRASRLAAALQLGLRLWRAG